MVKAIITDLDRTLLRTDKSMPEYTLNILKKCKDKGILLFAATARTVLRGFREKKYCLNN